MAVSQSRSDYTINTVKKLSISRKLIFKTRFLTVKYCLLKWWKYNKNKSSQGNKVDVQTQELYQLAMFLQEAMMREEALNKKLRTIQTFIDQAKENSENGWLVKN